jgi:hypothetical protein
LAGTETLPIVQGGVTVKTTVADITNGGGYSGSFTTLASTGNTTLGDASTDTVRVNGYMGVGGAAVINYNVLATGSSTNGSNQYSIATTAALSGTSNSAAFLASHSIAASTAVTSGTGFRALNITLGSGASITDQYGIRVENLTSGTNNYGIASLVSSGTNKYNIYASGTASNYFGGGVNVGATTNPGAGNISLTGNVIQGTAAKGFDFSANTPLAGKTSTILNWYEEGTWTPNQGAGLTLVGAFSSTGKYTRIGRNVTISGTVTGATSVALAAAGVITSNLPFTVGTAGHGNATNVAVNASAAIICTGTSVTSAGAIAATVTITFSATYFV